MVPNQHMDHYLIEATGEYNYLTDDSEGNGVQEFPTKMMLST